jgi:hypothetical protein
VVRGRARSVRPSPVVDGRIRRSVGTWWASGSWPWSVFGYTDGRLLPLARPARSVDYRRNGVACFGLGWVLAGPHGRVAVASTCFDSPGLVLFEPDVTSGQSAAATIPPASDECHLRTVERAFETVKSSKQATAASNLSAFGNPTGWVGGRWARIGRRSY